VSSIVVLVVLQEAINRRYAGGERYTGSTTQTTTKKGQVRVGNINRTRLWQCCMETITLLLFITNYQVGTAQQRQHHTTATQSLPQEIERCQQDTAVALLHSRQ
jgi:hypothetical protein